MGKKRGKDQNTGRRLWGILGALWLAAVCLAGCAATGNDGGSQAGGDRAVQAAGWEAETGETETGETDSGGQQAEEIQGGETWDGEREDGQTGVWEEESGVQTDEESGQTQDIEESGAYTSKEQVALYLHIYGRLPGNYITKRDAQDLGWDSKEGNLWEVAPGMSIGGSRFGNYEGALPEKEGRRYFECDIDYEGGYRGAKRLIYSDDGLIFYTEDHYNTFEQLYGQ